MDSATTWNPNAFEPAACDHDALPAEHASCIVCGWRNWLTFDEERYQLERPWTAEEKRQIKEGTAWPGKFANDTPI